MLTDTDASRALRSAWLYLLAVIIAACAPGDDDSRSASVTNRAQALAIRVELGSVREVVAGDGRTTASRRNYDPWGSPTESGAGATSDFGFTEVTTSIVAPASGSLGIAVTIRILEGG